MSAWAIRTSLSAWTSRCGICGVTVACDVGGLVLVIEYDDRSGDPVCDGCAQRHDGLAFARLVCERIAAEPCRTERADPLERGTHRSAFRSVLAGVCRG